MTSSQAWTQLVLPVVVNSPVTLGTHELWLQMVYHGFPQKLIDAILTDYGYKETMEVGKWIHHKLN